MKRLVVLSMAVAGVCVVAGSGCDDAAEANQNVSKKLADANAQLAKLPGLRPVEYQPDGTKADTPLKAVRTDLSTAISEPGASPSSVAVASGHLGAVDQHAALLARADLISVEQKVRRELTYLRQLVQQVAFANMISAAYKAQDPAAALANVAQQVQAMQGNANVGLWGPGVDPKIIPNLMAEKTLPTLAAVKADISRLEGEITKRQQQIEQLTKTRSDAIAAAESSLQKADTQKGDEAVKTYSEAAEQRRQADDTAIQIDLVQDQLKRLQADLAVQKGQEATLDASIAEIQAQSKRISDAWAATQKQVDQQTGIAKLALSGEKEGDVSIGSRAAAINKLLEDAKKRREDLLDLLQESEKYYDNAASQSASFASSMAHLTSSQSANAASYKLLANSIHPQRYKLQKGIVQREIGSIRASHASLVADVEASRTLLQTALAPASLTMPPELEGVDTGTLKDLVTEADTALVAAIETLTGVETGDSGDQKKYAQNSAKVAKLIALVSRMHLLELKASIGDTAAGTDATSLKTDAQQLKKEILEQGLSLPPLPGEFGEMPPPTAPAPVAPEGGTPPADGTAPTTPATPPAEGGTTPAAPAEGVTTPPAAPPAEGGNAPAMPAEPPAAPAAPAAE